MLLYAKAMTGKKDPAAAAAAAKSRFRFMNPFPP
jgi:hypothetical protein